MAEASEEFLVASVDADDALEASDSSVLALSSSYLAPCWLDIDKAMLKPIPPWLCQSAQPTAPPDPHTNIMDICMMLPSAVDLDSVSSIPKLPTMMEINAAYKMISSNEISISGDDINIGKFNLSALSSNRNNSEMAEFSSVETPRTEGKWDICCLEHGSQPAAVDASFLFDSGTAKKTTKPIQLKLSPIPFLDLMGMRSITSLLLFLAILTTWRRLTWSSLGLALSLISSMVILSLNSGLYLLTEWWRAHEDANALREVSLYVDEAGKTSDSAALAFSSNLASLHIRVPSWSCLSDYASLFNFIKTMDKGSLCSTDSSVSISYLAWLVTTGLVHIEDITAWKYFPQVINVCSKIRVLILHFSQAGLEVPPWPLSRLNFLLSAMMCSLAPSWIPSSTLMWEVCCRPIRGLFMVTEWWLLGEPPPWASSNYIAQDITNYLAMPSTCLPSSVAGAFMFHLYLCCCTMHRETLLAPSIYGSCLKIFTSLSTMGSIPKPCFSSPTSMFKKRPSWPSFSTSSLMSVLPITSSSYWLGSSSPIKSMLASEAAELLLVLGEMSTELSNLCMELQSITSSSSVDLWKPPWALYYSYLLPPTQSLRTGSPSSGSSSTTVCTQPSGLCLSL